MIGGEFKKERFSERLANAQNQPKNRGYLHGTHLKTCGYGTGTLIGNWSEERSDAGYYDGRAVVASGMRPPWSTTYREMVQNVSTPVDFSTLASGTGSSDCVTTGRTSTNPLCDRSLFSQQTFISIEDHKERSYPAHQPYLDPAREETIESACHSTYRHFYTHPDVRLQEVKSYVPPVLGNGPSSHSTSVLLRLRRQLELAQESCDGSLGRCLVVSAFPGNIIHCFRKGVASACTDPTGKINADELREGCAAVGLTVSPAECVALLRYFDHEGHHTAPYIEIVQAIRGEMKSRRATIVESVYNLLRSLSPEGAVRLDRLVEWIDVAQLPSVQSGSVAADAARAAFAAQWDSPKPTAHITQARFAEYFADASFEIPLENTFELIMRNMWHLSGGRDHCANTSCRRVEVVHTNGRVTHNEIKDDLLIREGDAATLDSQLRANLVKQGIKDIKSVRVISSV